MAVSLFDSEAHVKPIFTPAVDAHTELEALDSSEEDAVIEVVMALNAESEEAYSKARQAAELLRSEYGIEAVVVPRVDYWGHLPLGVSSYPRIYVNGELVAVGDVDVEYLVDAVLAMLGLSESKGMVTEPTIPRGGIHGGVALAAAVA